MSESYDNKGAYYGYPECCQTYFDNRIITRNFVLTKNQHLTHNNGFIPCVKCADYLIENKLPLQVLIKNRICSHKFPLTYRCWDAINKKIDCICYIL